MLTGRSGQFNPHTSVYMLTEHWQGPVTTDQMRPVPFFPHWMLTVLDRTLDPQGLVITDRTRPVVDLLFWNLTGVDRTLPLNVRSLDHSASGRTRRNLLGQMN